MSRAGVDIPDRISKTRLPSTASARLKVSASTAFRSRGSRAPSRTASKQQQQQQHQQQAQLGAQTILQRRERLRVYDNGEDVTPRTLIHPGYGSVEDRRTAFDQLHLGSSRTTSVLQVPSHGRPSIATVTSSFSSLYSLDVDTPPLPPTGEEQREQAASEEDAPSQYRLAPRDSRLYVTGREPVTLVLRETETFFLFELAQLVEDATSQAGQLVAQENQRYLQLRNAPERKSVPAETQTPAVYAKSRGTNLPRRERKNRATFVNHWVMHDAYANQEMEDRATAGSNEDKRFKFPETKGSESIEQLEAIGSRPEYSDAARVTLRILASKDFEVAQKRFAGLLRQDPCDPELQLVYGIELLWRHSNLQTQNRPVSNFRWNPVNTSLLAVGYAAVSRTKKSKVEEAAAQDGLVLIWCAKNPTEPDRCFKFDSPVSDLDWSKNMPNLLAVGFYDGKVRVINVSKKQLSVVRESDRKTSPSYEPHWQVQWWSTEGESFDGQQHQCEQLVTGNQDGRVSVYSVEGEFASREILRLQCLEGSIPGVRRMNHCPSREVPISRNPGVLVLLRQSTSIDNSDSGDSGGPYLVGTEEGCVLRCATARPGGHFGGFLGHDGPVYGLAYSPFCDKLLLSCGADWCARLWADGLDEQPLLTYGTRMAPVYALTWSPRNSTVFATAVANEVCIWDISRTAHGPASVHQVCAEGTRLTRLEFTRSGEQLVAADERGEVHVYGLAGMPLPAFDPQRSLVVALRRALVTRPELLARLHKLGPPFDL